MKRFFIILLFLSQVLSAQTELKHEVYFDTDQYEILPTEQSRLLLFLSQIEGLDIEKISIYGFCDDRGSDNYNLVLSQNRANAIKEVFSNNEFDESTITNVDGKGEVLIKIVKEDDLEKIRGLNRKVEIIVTQVFPPRPKEDRKPETADVLKGDLKVGDKIVLENLLFRTGYSYLVKESRQTLEDIANVLVKRKDINFTIQGHVCCTYGTRDAVDRKTRKRNLSVARAKYIYDYLLERGVSRLRMKYEGLRRKFPLGGDPKFDRRVEILVTKINTSD
ncbi:OmpA family protein [Ichthyenterobacterium sp. W332]|uniref:OmpA family protein n=1 Tax=Microcosmobacter mediterraneus TaxID=3075607 RepID=A0ABU2YJE9_9FLAO|nr:OmpA family protein [Ichthyenterobacterium sp. W332]MDT0558011.1 OmpA family protein [Ichthyenterobacterium sp. W332]